jgi:hypothetical protein
MINLLGKFTSDILLGVKHFITPRVGIPQGRTMRFFNNETIDKETKASAVES